MYIKLEENEPVEVIVSKLLAIADVPRNAVKPSFRVKALGCWAAVGPQPPGDRGKITDGSWH